MSTAVIYAWQQRAKECDGSMDNDLIILIGKSQVQISGGFQEIHTPVTISEESSSFINIAEMESSKQYCATQPKLRTSMDSIYENQAMGMNGI